MKYNLDIKIFEKYIDIYFENAINKNSIENNIDLEIYSPFFDYLIKKKYFNEFFTIPIKMIYNQKLNSNNEYISIFKLLNVSNITYSSIKFDYLRNDDIDFLKELNINFNNIKRFEINEDWENFSFITNYEKNIQGIFFFWKDTK